MRCDEGYIEQGWCWWRGRTATWRCVGLGAGTWRAGPAAACRTCRHPPAAAWRSSLHSHCHWAVGNTTAKYRWCTPLVVTSTSQVSQVSLLAGPRHAGDWRCGRGAAAADQLPCGEAPCREYPPWTGRRAAAARHTHTHSHEAGTLHPRPEHFSYKQECFKCRGKACKNKLKWT